MHEIAVNNSQWAIIRNMLLEILSLRCLATLVGTLHWVIATHRPVVACNVVIMRIEILAVHTTEGSFWALIVLVNVYDRALERLRTVQAVDLNSHAAL